MALKKLSPVHDSAIRCRIEGKSAEETAKLLNVKVRTIYEWFSDPLIKAEVDLQRQNISDMWMLRMTEMASIGVSELIELMRLPVAAGDGTGTPYLTPAQKLDVIVTALDRHPETAKMPTQVGGGQQNTLVISPETTDDQLIDRAHALLVKAGKVPAVIDGTASDSKSSK